MKRWQSLLLGLVISVATLAFAMRGTDFSQLGGELARGRYIYFIPATIICALGLVLRGVRWRVLLDNKMALSHSINILNASYLFNTILPARLGEVVRAYMATRVKPSIPMFTSLSTVIVERVTDMLLVVLMLIWAITMTPNIDPIVIGAAKGAGLLAIVGAIVLVIFAVRRTLAHRILDIVLRILPFLKRFNLTALADRVLDGIAPLGSPRSALEIIFWTIVSWIPSIAQVLIMMYIFYDQPQFNAGLLLISMASLAVALPAAPGNVGPFEAAIVLGLTAGGMALQGDPTSQTRALAYAVVMHVMNVLVYAGLGFFGLAQENISLGEVMQAARQIASRSKSVNGEPTTETVGAQD